MSPERYTIEVGHAAVRKAGEAACGDAFHSMRVQGEGRVILVLTDGLGSGIKASVFSTLTAAMASRFAEALRNPAESAELILRTLPVCSVRGIGYSTLTVLTMRPDGEVQIAGHGNPPTLLVREGKTQLPVFSREPLHSFEGASLELETARFKAQPGDRLVLMTDGITQSGIRRGSGNLGFGSPGVMALIDETLSRQPALSAQALSERILEAAVARDGGLPGDDACCVAVHYRKPRKALVLTGPPYERERDRDMAQWAKDFDGTRMICGGTTATLVARELNCALDVDFSTLSSGEPPGFTMPGFDLVTEGAITLNKVLEMLETGRKPADTPSGKLLAFLLNSDDIRFVVGMWVNAAHHDPTLPIEMDIRRNTVRRISRILTERHLKEVSIDYI